jgi:hypothetical protein
MHRKNTSILQWLQKATKGLEPIRNRGALLSTLIHVSLITTTHNRSSTYQLQRNATEHNSTGKSHSHKPQQVQYLSVIEERY